MCRSLGREMLKERRRLIVDVAFMDPRALADQPTVYVLERFAQQREFPHLGTSDLAEIERIISHAVPVGGQAPEAR